MGIDLTHYLADACALIAFYLEDSRLPQQVADIIENQTDSVSISSITIWEISIKNRLGKLPDIRAGNHPSLTSMFRAQGYQLIEFNGQMAELAASLPNHHSDPFDRGLVAVASTLGLTVLSSDRVVALYNVPILWR